MFVMENGRNQFVFVSLYLFIYLILKTVIKIFSFLHGLTKCCSCFNMKPLTLNCIIVCTNVFTYVKLKVKLSQCLIEHHTLKT
jgi:hypothetical protein